MALSKISKVAFLCITLMVTDAFSPNEIHSKPHQTQASASPMDTSRRTIFSQVSSVVVSTLTAAGTQIQSAHAIGEGEERMVFRKKPTAPISALVPTIQQRLLLEVAIEATKKKDWNKIKTMIPKLNEDDNSYVYILLGASKSRDMDSKVMKKYDPGYVLRGDLTRATMNLYQTNLNYNNILSNSNNPSEVITVTDPDWKKSYIRANDGLPDLSKIIGADLDLRQLLRNAVQEKLDDAAAELYAQDFDEEELLGLLSEAAFQFDNWLDRVRYGDVKDAIEIAVKGERIMIVDSYAVGFIPPK